jgi:regulator of replication initiation timing
MGYSLVDELKNIVDELENENKQLTRENEDLKRRLESVECNFERLQASFQKHLNREKASKVVVKVTNNPNISKDMKRRLLQLCHPDKHNNSESSKIITQWLLSLND